MKQGWGTSSTGFCVGLTCNLKKTHFVCSGYILYGQCIVSGGPKLVHQAQLPFGQNIQT
jgi:hypothetical protein